MATIYKLLGIFCLTFLGGFVEPSSYFLRVLTEVEGLGVVNEGLAHTANCQLPTENSYFNRSLPRGQFHFSLMKNETKTEPLASSLMQFKDNKNRLINQDRNDASTLTSNTWPAVPACPTLFGSVYHGLKLRRNKVKSQQMIEQSNKRILLLAIAKSQVGIREATSKNDGAAVEAYLGYTGNKKGAPWCASFVSWVFGRAGFAKPRTAWSPALFPKNRQILAPFPADVFGIYLPSLKRIGHCGLVEVSKGNWIQTIEGNTNADGAREGNGVYRKLRHKRTIAVYANWVYVLKKGEMK